MKELFDLLDAKERQLLVLLCILLSAVLVFHSAFALKEKRTYFRSVKSLPIQEKEFERIREQTSEKKREWVMWDEARRDSVEIGTKYFYREDKNINELRQDLRRIFQNAQVQILSDLRFEYDEFQDSEMKIVKVSFTMAGPYFSLKKLIHQVEMHPKFLMIERIDFMNINTQSGRIELRIELAGYYER